MASTTTARVAPVGTDAVDGRRYTAPAQWLHWLTPPLILAQVAIAWIMMSLPEHDPRGGLMFSLHKSLGITIWLVIAMRLAWRFTHPAPRHGPNTPRALALVADTNHWLMYAVFFCMPISGYVMSAMGSHGVQFWGIPMPSIPRVPAIQKLADTGHSLGQWAVYALVLLHVAGAAYHVFIRKDGVLERMLPAQVNADPTRPI